MLNAMLYFVSYTLGEHALEVRTIYRPDDDMDASSIHDYNQIYEIVTLIDATIKASVQKRCEVVEKRCQIVQQAVER